MNAALLKVAQCPRPDFDLSIRSVETGYNHIFIPMMSSRSLLRLDKISKNSTCSCIEFIKIRRKVLKVKWLINWLA